MVPQNLLVLFRNLRYGHRETARIRPQENVNLILAQKPEYVRPGSADLTVIVIPYQTDSPFLLVAQGNATLSIHVRLPEADSLQRLPAQEAESASQGDGQPDRNLCPIAHRKPTGKQRRTGANMRSFLARREPGRGSQRSRRT